MIEQDKPAQTEKSKTFEAQLVAKDERIAQLETEVDIETNRRMIQDGNVLHLAASLTRLEAEFEKMGAALNKIRIWADAYPLDMFPEPTKEDWKEIARLLKDNGYLLDSVSSSNMRHVINGVKALVEDVLDRIEGE